MHAVFTFDEGTGGQLLDGAPAGGLIHGTLLGGPVWVRSGPTPPAVVRHEGTQQDFGGAWRTPSSNKSRDVDGDQFVNRAPAKPFYLTSMEAMTGSYPGNERYAFIDDPENPGTTFMTGTQNPAPGSGQSANVFRFTLNAYAIGRLIRVGVMIDHLDNAAYNPASLRLVQVTGGAAGGGRDGTFAPVMNHGNLNLTECAIVQNQCRGFSYGPILNYRFGRLRFTRCTLSGNQSTEGAGGAVNNQFGSVVLRQCTLSDDGGPTLTMALLPDSPAVDVGSSVPEPGVDGFDQRGSGYARRSGPGGWLDGASGHRRWAVGTFRPGRECPGQGRLCLRGRLRQSHRRATCPL